MKPQKKITVNKMKANVWTAFSLYIRVRDCLKTCGGRKVIVEKKDGTVDEVLVGKCVTCSREYTLKQLQAGHFIPGRNNTVLFEERGVHAQCYHCNVGLKGNPRKYDKFMRDTYGIEVVEELDYNSNQFKDFTVPELQELLVYYKRKTAQLLNSGGDFNIWD